MKISRKSSSTPPSPIMRFFFGRIFPIPFILAGAAVLFSGLRDINRAIRSTEWPVAEGVIVESKVASHRGSKGGTQYSAQIRYTYTVGGALQKGDRVAFGDSGSTGADNAHQIVNRHPVGQRTDIRHAPDDAALSVLEPGLKARAWVAPVFGAVFFSVGCTMAVFLPRAMRKQAEQAEQKAELAESGHTLADLPVASTHPKVTISKGIDATVFETRNSPGIGIFMILFPIAMSTFIAWQFHDAGALRAIAIPFFLGDFVMLMLGGALLFSRYTVTVASGKVALCFGIAGKGYRKEIALLSPMSVTLEHRGSSQNGRKLDAIVVRNADGAEFHFGSFLDDSRKNFLAGHLARMLVPKVENPFR